MTNELTGGELDTLVALVEDGPLWDGDVPSKSDRDTLLEKGLAAKVLVKGEDGYQAATYAGREVYCKHFGGNTVQEAKEIRKRQRAERTDVSLCSMSAPLPVPEIQLRD